MPSYYPVFLNLKGRRCVVIGGGQIAEGKIRNLLKHDCCIQIISPDVTAAIGQWVRDAKITWRQRLYQEGDLKNAFLAIAATGDTAVGEVIAREAESEKVLLNVVDYTPLCMFIAPSVVERGDVTMAISTSGSSPALARKLRESVEQSDILEYAELAGLLSRTRKEVKKRGLKVPPDRWQQYITKDLVTMVREGRDDEAMEKVLRGLASGQESA